MQQVKILVKGKVQGVFFRKNTRQEADKLGLKGYAKNLDEGHVEIVAQGEEQGVKALIDWCYQGPEMAEVKEVDIKYEEIDKEYENFITL